MTIFLTQQEGDALLALEKHYTGKVGFSFPGQGGRLNIPLFSNDRHEEFILDITRGCIKLQKNTFQARARKAVILVRLDIGGSPHRNPDGEEIPCPHLHYYQEGCGDKWAKPLPSSFTNHEDSFHTLFEFMDFCNIKTKPRILKGIFTQ